MQACKGTAIPLQAWTGPEVVSPTQQPPLPPGNIPRTHFCYRLSWPQGHGAARRIMSNVSLQELILLLHQP